MSAQVGGAFPADALEVNRQGRLTDLQRRNLGFAERAWWKNELVGALVAAVIGVLILTSSGGTTSPAIRLLFGVVALIVAAFFVYRSIPGTNALAQDLRSGRVETVEGPFGKHTTSGGGRSTTTFYYFDIAERHLEVSRAAYEAAPEAGIVRLYVLPHSHKVVNLERLPDRPLPEGALDSPVDALKTVAAGFRSHDQTTRLEAMATMEALKDAVQAQVHATPPPPDQRDPRPLAEAILGTWHLGPMSVSFAADGTATDTMPNGKQVQGRWSVLTDGRLRIEGMGRDQDAEAWVAGDTLTVRDGTQAVAFKRTAPG